MNQSNKKNLEFIKNAGVNYFLQDTARNWFENPTNSSSKQINDMNGDKSQKISQIIDKIKNFDTPLKKTAKNLVVYDGSFDAKVMFIGEAPGRDEDTQGLPFVGRAGQLLNKMLSAINLKREEVYITNVVNWRPPDNRTPTDDEILQFLPFLQEQIDVVNPDFIFLLGGVAAKAILSTPLALGKLRGSWHEYQSLQLNKKIYTIASYHPAFLLRSPQYKKASWEDLQMLQKKINEKN
tara:strand:+ start:1103 stop:1813 length:711 start_codon:yes stop_codon:yes gene_type:complete